MKQGVNMLIRWSMTVTLQDLIWPSAVTNRDISSTLM